VTGSDTGQGGPPEGVGLAAFNAMPAAQARAALLACCGAARWAERVADGRPYPSLAALLDRAGAALTDEDVSEALAGHPRIGQSPAKAQSSWSRTEQAAVAAAGDEILAQLAEGNRAYEERFGHIYLVCAAGRSASDLLAILRERLRNDPESERQVSRDELRKINELRLARMIGPAGPAGVASGPKAARHREEQHREGQHREGQHREDAGP
jgi:2-oxo-4-hydroxy-4-carboxy-5-ureidoimidazoline decarboxylase